MQKIKKVLLSIILIIFCTSFLSSCFEQSTEATTVTLNGLKKGIYNASDILSPDNFSMDSKEAKEVSQFQALTKYYYFVEFTVVTVQPVTKMAGISLVFELSNTNYITAKRIVTENLSINNVPETIKNSMGETSIKLQSFTRVPNIAQEFKKIKIILELQTLSFEGDIDVHFKIEGNEYCEILSGNDSFSKTLNVERYQLKSPKVEFDAMNGFIKIQHVEHAYAYYLYYYPNVVGSVPIKDLDGNIVKIQPLDSTREGDQIFYDLSGIIFGEKKIVVQAVGQEGKYINPSYSDPINIVM